MLVTSIYELRVAIYTTLLASRLVPVHLRSRQDKVSRQLVALDSLLILDSEMVDLKSL
jgi:hypothetical protein